MKSDSLPYEFLQLPRNQSVNPDDGSGWDSKSKNISYIGHLTSFFFNFNPKVLHIFYGAIVQYIFSPTTLKQVNLKKEKSYTFVVHLRIIHYGQVR